MFFNRRPFRATITLVAVGALVAALALLAAPSISAQTGLGCPDGFVPASDGNGCVSESVGAFNDNVTTTSSCVEGVLSADGTQCLVPRLDAAPAPAPAAPVAVPAQAFTG